MDLAQVTAAMEMIDFRYQITDPEDGNVWVFAPKNIRWDRIPVVFCHVDRNTAHCKVQVMALDKDHYNEFNDIYEAMTYIQELME